MESYVHGQSGATTTTISPLNVARRLHGCSSITRNGAVLVIAAGGQGDGNSYLSSVEVVQRTGGGAWSRWTTVGQLPQPRGRFPLVNLGGSIFGLGGYDGGDNRLSSIVTTTDDGRTWATLDARLETGRYGHTAVSTATLCG